MRFFVLLLVVVLTLPTVGTVRRLHIDTPVLRPIPKDLQDVLVSANKLFTAGDFVTSAPIYQKGLEAATSRHETRAISRFLHGAGNCNLLVADYGTAVQEYLEARKLAIAVSVWAMVTFLSINLYTAYPRMKNLPAARQSIQFAAARI